MTVSVSKYGSLARSFLGEGNRKHTVFRCIMNDRNGDVVWKHFLFVAMEKKGCFVLFSCSGFSPFHGLLYYNWLDCRMVG